MGVSEPQRLALHAAARKALGAEEGDTLMALSPPANTDIATMQALEQLEERFDAKLGEAVGVIDARFDAFFGMMNTRFEHAQALTDARIA